ncbi:MAG: deoxynucleoside kinase [bacterium]
MPGKLIVIDGTDGCGKATQTKKLIERLIDEGHNPATLDFPQYYNNHFGNIVGCFLRGDFGDPTKTNPYLASILYAADRFESSKKIKAWLAEGKIVILDRYVSANQIHQGSKIQNEQERETFLRWLEAVEHGVFNIPRPDLIIYLDVPTKTAQNLIEKKSSRNYTRGAAKDQNESNVEYQASSREQSLRLVARMNHWQRIACEENGELLPIDIIHEKIWAIVCDMI